MRLVLIVMLPFLGALLPMLLARAGRRACAIATGLTTLTAFVLLLTHGPLVLAGEAVSYYQSWIPQLGMDLALRLDGLGFLMAGLILGIGLLIIIYAYFYLGSDEPIGVFFTYLLLFQGAMVGIALCDNILALLVFWEGTSLASFLLIGFWRHLPEARQGARMALVVTGGGGLALIAGMLLLGEIAGTYTISEMVGLSALVQTSELFPLALLLVAVGCLTKSAQFPFHFWLPHAMAAPTPVSAYLHSATMVKAGVFLLARMWPILSDNPWWFYLLTTTGVVTFILGAVVALFKDDLKAMLAYSTISHLGLITMLLGLGTVAGLVAALLHLMNHAVFKGALFLTVGIIDHETGTRDIKRLGGLWWWLPVTGTVALMAVAANAGLPPFGGFISKEMMLEEVGHITWFGYPRLLAGLATLAGLFSFAYSLRFFIKVFLGRTPEGMVRPHGPSWGLAIPGLFLAMMALGFGLYVEQLASPIIRAAFWGALGRETAVDIHLKLWHGVNTPLLLSGFAFLAGGGMLITHRRWERLFSKFSSLDFKAAFDRIVSWTEELSRRVVSLVQSGSLSRYLVWMLVATLLLGGNAFFTSEFQWGTREPLPINGMAIVLSVLMLFTCWFTIANCGNRLLSLIAANVVGLIAAIGFIYFSAPDLALTQISVEVVTLILVLLALYFLPKETVVEGTTLKRGRDIVLAVLAGLAMFGLTWAVLSSDGPKLLADYFIEQSKPAGGGSNVVNVILVDFRGFDTFNEIVVLAISALIIYALLDGAMHGPAAAKLDGWEHDMPRSPEKHPTMLISFTRVLLPLALMVGIYMFLRGHDRPGGGFIAGLVVTIAIITQYMVSGFQWAADRISIDYHAWLGWGLLLAAGTGAAAIVLDYPFLTNAHKHFDLPYFGELDLSSALVFDLGVLMTVVGAVMLALANLSRLGRRAERAAAKAVEATTAEQHGD
jgi:multicomponent K+:H+ antiporter subunit A